MRYHGTDIDGVFIEPDRLEIRGHDLNDIVREKTYPQALSNLFFGASDNLRATLIDRCLKRALASVSADSCDIELVALARESGATVSQCVTAGLMAKSEHIKQDSLEENGGLSEDLVESLHYVGVLPAYVCTAISTSTDELAARLSHTSRSEGAYVEAVAALFVDDPSKESVCVLNWLLVAWHAGFGYLPPSVMMPRISIGTGVAIRQAIGAGFAAAGPSHIGACEFAMQLFNGALSKAGTGDVTKAMEAIIGGLLDNGSRVPGFGHPLFQEDPRPGCLRALAAQHGVTSQGLEAFDAACDVMKRRTGLSPNIDAISGGLFLTMGITNPGAGANIAMAARSAGMVAHILERKNRPAFGVTSDIARKHLDNLPKDWL